MMKRELLLGLPLAAAMSLLGHAGVSDNFESYVLGSELHGQGNWQGWGNDLGATAYVSSDFAASGSQSMKVDGAADQVLTFSGITSGGPWIFKIKQYIPSTSSGLPYIVMCNQYPPATNDGYSIQIQCDMDSGKMIDDFGGSAQVAMVKDAWVEWRFEIDLTANTVTTFYNNTLFTTHPWKGGDGSLELAALDLPAYFCGPLYYDDLEVIPPHGASDSWAADVAGSWSDVTKWASGGQYPDAVGNVATFSQDLTVQRVVAVDTPITLGGIVFNDPTVSAGQDRTAGSGFLVALGANNLLLDTGSAGHGSADLVTIDVPSTNTGVGHGFSNTTGKLVLTDNVLFHITNDVELGLGDGLLAGAGSLTLSGGGQLVVAGDNSAYSGALRVEGGRLQSRGNVNAHGGGTITLTNNGALDHAGYFGTGPVFSNHLILEKTVSAGDFPISISQSPGLTWAGGISNAGAPLDADLVFGNDNGGLSYSMFGLTGNNSGLAFAAGRGFVTGNNHIGVGNNNALGAGNSAAVAIGADPTSQEGLLATVPTTIASPITVSGGGNVSAAVIGANITSGTATYTGTLTLNAAQHGNVRQTFLRSETGGTVVFNSGSVIGNAATNGAYGPLTKIGGGRVELNGNNSFLGNAAVRSGELVASHSNALGAATSTVSLGEASPVMADVRVATTWGGYREAPGTWTSTGGGTYTGAPAALDGVTLAVNDRVLVKDHGAQNGIYVVSSLGPNVWVRATDLNTTGQLVYGQQVRVTEGAVNAGRVYFQGGRGSGPYPGALTLNTSPLDYHLDSVNPDVALLNNGVTIGRDIAVVANGSTGRSILGGINAGASAFSGNITLARDLAVTAAAGGSVAFSGNITGGAGVTKEGDGTVVFSGTNGYTGATAITAGTLVVNGTLASGGVTVNAGATLRGGGVMANGIVVGGTLAPGNLIGILTVGSAAFATGGVFAVEVDGGGVGACDRLNVAGNLNLTHATLSLSVGTPLDDPVYVIANYGTLTGIFAGVVNPPAGYGVVYNYNSLKQLALVQNALIDYSDWTNGIVGFADTAPAADPDGDGLANQQEYAFGLNPTLGSSANPITAPLNKGTGKFSYTRRAPSLTGLGYTIKTSADMVTWTTDAGAAQAVTGTAGDIQTVEVTVSPGLLANPKLFVRVAAQ